MASIDYRIVDQCGNTYDPRKLTDLEPGIKIIKMRVMGESAD